MNLNSLISTEEDFKEYLEQQGYKICSNSTGSDGSEGSFSWVACKRLDTNKQCLCNEKPPQYVIEGHDSNYFLRMYRREEIQPLLVGFKISIKAEASKGDWCDLGYYGCSAEDIEKLGMFESRLLNAWEAIAEGS